MNFEKIKERISRSLVRFAQRDKFAKDFLPTLPRQFQKLVQYSFDQNLTAAERDFGKKIEGFRREISSMGDTQTFGSYSSPHSGSQLQDDSGKLIPGNFGASSAAAHAATGTNVFGGTELRHILESIGGGRVLELGTNTGLSGCYFLSSGTLSELVTIEGSADLSKIAEKNLARISNKFCVINDMFDDAIKLLRQKNETFDVAFIDGQHEKQATLYYARALLPLLKPNGVLIFDDIYWSQDMNQAWKQLCFWPEFAITIDLGRRGICVLREGNEKNEHYDVCDYSGRPSIYRKSW